MLYAMAAGRGKGKTLFEKCSVENCLHLFRVSLVIASVTNEKQILKHILSTLIFAYLCLVPCHSGASRLERISNVWFRVANKLSSTSVTKAGRCESAMSSAEAAARILRAAIGVDEARASTVAFIRTVRCISTYLRRMNDCSCAQALCAMFTAKIAPIVGGKGGACWFIRAKAAAQRLEIMV